MNPKASWMSRKRTFPVGGCLLSIIPLLLWACAPGDGGGAELSIEAYRSDLEKISSDEMEGRGPGTEGGERAARFIAQRFEEIGLKPGNGDSYFQKVPLVGMTADPGMQLILKSRRETQTYHYSSDFVAWSGVEREAVSIKDAEVVFVGYGVTAPEVEWNDYKGRDLSSKILMVLVNDPPSDDPNHFGANALTYYGRWTYKLEEAARQGAVGVLLVHNTDMAGYPWQVVDSSWTGEQFSLPGSGDKSTLVESWITQEAATKILATAGLSFEEALERAAKADFQPVDIPLKASIEIQTKVRRIDSPNVLGLVEGSDPELRHEIIIVTSHYDHFGRGKAIDGDDIYNGSFDNASGTAALIEVGRVLSQGNAKPRRSVLLAAVTAEEQGLLGSAYYAANPVFPLSKTAANVNFDGVNVWGRTASMVAMGAERSSILATVREIASTVGMKLAPDTSPEKGYFFRSDHFSLVKVGVPAVYLDMADDFEGKPADWGEKMMEEYVARHYHQPSDEFDPDWSLEGALQAMDFSLRTIKALADADAMPTWNAGDAFEEIRRKSLEGR